MSHCGDNQPREALGEDESKISRKSIIGSSSNAEDSCEEEWRRDSTAQDPLELYSNDPQSDLSDIEESTDDEELVNDLKRTFDKISRTFEKSRSGWRQLENTMLLESPSDNNLFEWRLSELRSMCSNLIRPEYILNSLEPTKQEYVISLASISKEQFEEKTRATWMAQDLFRYAGRMAHIMSFLANSHRRYPWWTEPHMTRRMKSTLSSIGNSAQKYSINHGLRMSLTTNPIHRSKPMIQQIIWFNQTVETFTELFPVEKETELAKCMGYEIYGNDRVIQYQGRVPQKLYYILYGKIELIYVYKLIEGEVHKSMGFLKQKQMNNVEDFENRVPAATYLVAKGRLEVLTIHIDDYLHLTNKANISSIQTFLHQINIFKEIYITESLIKSHIIKLLYFRNGKVITQDALKDLYFYVVESGTVVVARNQRVYDNDMSYLWRFSNISTLGCKRNENHASLMIGVNSPKLVITSQPDEPSFTEQSDTWEEPKVVIEPITIKSQTSIGLQTILEVENPEPVEELNKSQTMIETTRTTDTSFYKQRCSVKSESKRNVSEKERITYVKLDCLYAHDIFGLDTVDNPDDISSSSLILISEGAEVILVNKRYFRDHIDNNTLLEIRKLVKTYMSEEEAKQFIDDENKWKMYKKMLMQKMISLHR